MALAVLGRRTIPLFLNRLVDGARNLASEERLVMIALVPPIPVLLLLGFIALLYVRMLPVSVMLPLVVIDDLAFNGMVVVIIRIIVVARVNGAPSGKWGER
jgi:hypothetical protein